MPSAVPFQQGLIGQYNNSDSPGVYVSWDSNTEFNSVYSCVFKGIENTDYLFPLIVHTCVDSNAVVEIGTPVALGAGATFVYCLTDKFLIAYQKQADTFLTKAIMPVANINSGKIPTTFKVNTLNGVEFLAVGYSSGSFDVVIKSGTTFVTTAGLNYSNICGISAGTYPSYDLAIFSNKVYFSYQNNVWAGDITLGVGNTLILGTATTGIVASSTNTINKIAVYANDRLAIADNKNILSEYLYAGNTNLDNSSGQWNLNYSMTPGPGVAYSAITYNNFGVILAADSYNNKLDLVVPANIIQNTKNYGTFNGFTYQVVSTTTVTTQSATVLNSIGGIGVGYQNFNTPTCISEDPDFNILVGDFNNRITYIPAALEYLTTVDAPLAEYIDINGTPADVYYIKQATYNYDNVKSLPPISGDELLIKSSVLYELNALLRVPVYDEEPLFGYNRKSATLAYGDIVTDPAPQVRITVGTNDGQRSAMYVLSPYVGFYNTLDQSTDDPFDAPPTLNNYPNGLYYRFTNEGKLYFFDSLGNETSIQEYDTILVTYYVKMFTNAQINNALYLALQAINAQPGLNKIQKVQSVPFWYDQTLVSGATYYLLRQLLIGLNQRERRLLVQDPKQGSFDAVANIKDTAKMYQEEFTELLKKLPLAKRPIMGTISVPEFAMPGGRSRYFRYMWKGGAS